MKSRSWSPSDAVSRPWNRERMSTLHTRSADDSSARLVLVEPRGALCAIGALLAGVTLQICGVHTIGWTLVLLGGGLLLYFRQPPRPFSDDPTLVLSPVDGVVESIGTDSGRPVCTLRCPITAPRTIRAPLPVESVRRVDSRTVRLEAECGSVSLCLPFGCSRWVSTATWVSGGAALGSLPIGRRVTVQLPPGIEPLVRPGDSVRAARTGLARFPARAEPSDSGS